MADKNDYAFMKTGFDLVESNNDRTTQENIVTSLVTYTEYALRTAATYVSHGTRKSVTAEDIKRALILEVFLFNNRPGLLEKAEEVKKALFGADVPEDEEDDDHESGGGGDIDEPFSPNDCECALCSAIGGIYDRWGAWEPANALEALLKRHIDGIGVDN